MRFIRWLWGHIVLKSSVSWNWVKKIGRKTKEVTLRWVQKGQTVMKKIRGAIWWITQLSLLITVAGSIKWSWIPFLVVLTSVCVFDILWVTARISIPYLVEAVCFFLSPKVGRIMAQTRSGDIIAYWSNTGKTTGRKVNPQTGKMEDGREDYSGFWFKYFGAHWISFDGVYTYPIITEMHENEEKTAGDYTEVGTTARSIFLIGTYRASIIFPTSEGMLLRVKFQVRSETLHCGVALALQCWPRTMLGAVIAVLRDKFGGGKIKDLISVNHEGKIDVANSATQSINDTEVRKILDLLNTGNTGNPSMEVLCGQKIVGLNLMEIDFVHKEDRDKYLAPFLAELEKEKTITDANAAAEKTKIGAKAKKDAAIDEAAAIKELGDATAVASEALMKAFSGDATAVAKFLSLREVAKMEGLKALGGNTIVDLGDSKKGDKQ